MHKNDNYQQYKKLHALLRQCRIEAGLDQNSLAQKLNKPQSFVSKYETGERRLDIIELRLICKYLGMTLIEFAERLEAVFPQS